MTLRGALLAACCFLLAVCGVIPAAHAHDYLVDSSPAANGTVRVAPKHVTLTFNDIVLSKPARPQITVKGPDGRYYETGCGSVTDRKISTPVQLGPRGKYTVTWRIVSADGHPVSSRISFTYAGEPTGTKGASTPTECTNTSTGSSARRSSSKHGGLGAGAISAMVIGGLGVLGVVALMMTRGRGRETDDAQDADDQD